MPSLYCFNEPPDSPPHRYFKTNNRHIVSSVNHMPFLIWNIRVCVLSCVWLCDPMDCSPPGSSVHGIFLAGNTGVGCHFFLQGIFLTQGLNLRTLCLLRWQADSLPLSHLEPLFNRRNISLNSTLFLLTRLAEIKYWTYKCVLLAGEWIHGSLPLLEYLSLINSTCHLVHLQESIFHLLEWNVTETWKNQSILQEVDDRITSRAVRRARSSVQRRKQVIGAVVDGVVTAGGRETLPQPLVEWKRHTCT